MRERERERETEKKARTFGCAGLNRDPVRFQVGEGKKKSEKCDASGQPAIHVVARAINLHP